MRVAILSSSRSGSKYASVFFSKMGLDIRHEKLGRDGGVGWPLLRMVNSKDFDVILHQVRNPWDAIASMPTHDNLLWRKVYRHLGCRVPRKKAQMCLKYWIEWNKRCEEAASMTYRVEDLRAGTETVEQLSLILGFNIEDVPEVSTRTNTRRRLYKRYFKENCHRYFRNKYFELYCEAYELAKRYGYDASWFEPEEPEPTSSEGPRRVVWKPVGKPEKKTRR